MIAILFLVLVPARTLTPAVERESLFKIAGDGELTMTYEGTDEAISIKYKDEDGSYSERALKQLDNFLRCRSDETSTVMSLKLIEKIDNISDNFGGSVVYITSGYRSPEHNSNLRLKLRRVDKDSFHTKGMAVDMKLPNVSKGTLAKYARSLNDGGVGDYRRINAIHVDSGPLRSW